MIDSVLLMTIALPLLLRPRSVSQQACRLRVCGCVGERNLSRLHRAVHYGAASVQRPSMGGIARGAGMAGEC